MDQCRVHSGLVSDLAHGGGRVTVGREKIFCYIEYLLLQIRLPADNRPAPEAVLGLVSSLHGCILIKRLINYKSIIGCRQ